MTILFKMSKITDLTLIQTLRALEEKQFSEAELNDAYKKRVDALNDTLNVYLNVQDPTSGIPVAVKDIIVTKGIPTIASSKILEGFIPPYNATVIDHLLEHNVSILGKVNNDEFAMGSSGENSAYMVTKNPWDLKKVPGGSSSGSVVAVAADMAVFSLGTDTGGSIRQPASLCNVVGLKPSYGRVSRYGSIALASSLDQIGPFTKSVADARLVLEWISGGDKYDSNVENSKFKTQSSKLENLIGKKVGVPKEYFGKGLNSGVEEQVRNAIKKLEELGAELVEVSLPHTEYAIAVYYIVLCSEVSSNLARFTGIRYGQDRSAFGAETKRRIMLGTFALSTGYFDDYFIKAAKVRTLIKQDFEKAFEQCDVIVGPASPTVAWNIGEKVSDPLTMYLSDTYTIPASLAGIPGLSLPCGFSDGLPVGLQILGRYMDEETILNVGEIYEQNTEWHLRKPDLEVARGA
jgi:aspartyl-tRNA(Asn)/glutamyl-tRNA(Gln) amidotransferase subunit A